MTDSPRNEPPTTEDLVLSHSKLSPLSDDTVPGGPEGIDPWVGREIDGRYRIERTLGQGGMGIVLLAEHIKLRKKVAIKVVLQNTGAPHGAHQAGPVQDHVTERFAREARMGGMLHHPHIASATDFGTLATGEAFLVLQYVPGTPLREEMIGHIGDWLFAAKVGAQIADALVAVHAANIVHRDVKPENILIERTKDSPDPHASLLDFGVASFVGDAEELNRKLTRAGMVVGTPGYVSPEQAVGEQADARADIYALGVVMWELVAGTLLFQGNSVTEILTKQLTERAPRLSTLQPNIPSAFDDLIGWMLETKRDERVSKITQVRDILKKLAADASELTIAARELPVVRPSRAPAGKQANSERSSGERSSGERSSGQRANGEATDRTAHHDRPKLGWWLAVLVITIGYAVVTAWQVADWLRETYWTPPPQPAAVVTIPEAPPAPAPEAVVAAPVDADLDVVLTSTDRRVREAAANRILGRALSDISPFARAAATFEARTRCEERRNALAEIRTLGDPRGRAVFERAASLPTRGCGFLGTGDCYRCLRAELRRGRRVFERTE